MNWNARYYEFENVETGERIVVDRHDENRKKARYKRMARGFVNYTHGEGLVYYKHITLTQRIESYHPKMLNSFVSNIRNRYRESAYIWTVELQERRYERTGEAVLHWHMILALPYGYDFGVEDMERLRRWWKYGNVDIRSVKRMNLAYILKYITKAVDVGVVKEYQIRRIGMSRIPYLWKYTMKNLVKVIQWAGYNLNKFFSDGWKCDRVGVYKEYWDEILQRWKKAYALVLNRWRIVDTYDFVDVF